MVELSSTSKMRREAIIPISSATPGSDRHLSACLVWGGSQCVRRTHDTRRQAPLSSGTSPRVGLGKRERFPGFASRNHPSSVVRPGLTTPVEHALPDQPGCRSGGSFCDSDRAGQAGILGDSVVAEVRQVRSRLGRGSRIRTSSVSVIKCSGPSPLRTQPEVDWPGRPGGASRPQG